MAQSTPWAEKERGKMGKIEERERKWEKDERTSARDMYSPHPSITAIVYLDLLKSHTKEIYPNYAYSLYKEIKVFES